MYILPYFGMFYPLPKKYLSKERLWYFLRALGLEKKSTYSHKMCGLLKFMVEDFWNEPPL